MHPAYMAYVFLTVSYSHKLLCMFFFPKNDIGSDISFSIKKMHIEIQVDKQYVSVFIIFFFGLVIIQHQMLKNPDLVTIPYMP